MNGCVQTVRCREQQIAPVIRAHRIDGQKYPSVIDKRHAIPLGYKCSTETRIASNMIHHCLEINFIKSA